MGEFLGAENDPLFNPGVTRRRRGLGAPVNGGSRSGGSSSTTTSSTGTVQAGSIPLLKKPAYPFSPNRYIQFVSLPAWEDLGSSWPDPGWTAPVQSYVRNQFVWVINKIMSHVKTMAESSLNTIITHINSTIDMMFDKMLEMGNSLIGGVNSMVKMLTDTLNNLARDIKAQLDALTKTVKDELAKAQKAINDTLAQAKKDLDAQLSTMRADLAQARKDIQTTLKTAQDEATKQFAVMQNTLINEQAKALEKARVEGLATIQKETAAARDQVTKAVKDALEALPKQVASVTAEEFKRQGLVAQQAAQKGSQPAFPSFFPFGGMGADADLLTFFQRAEVPVRRFFRGLHADVTPMDAGKLVKSLFGLGDPNEEEVFSMRIFKPNPRDQATNEDVEDANVFDESFNEPFKGSDAYPQGRVRDRDLGVDDFVPAKRHTDLANGDGDDDDGTGTDD